MKFLKPKVIAISLASNCLLSLPIAGSALSNSKNGPPNTYIYVKSDSLTQEFVIEQLLSGAALGGAMGVLGGYLGYLRDEREPHGCIYTPKYMLYGALAGATIGSSLGVYLYSNRGATRGSYLATLAGATIGPVVGAGIGALLSELLKEEGSNIVLIGALSGFPVGAVAGYNFTRKKRIVMETNDALLNFRNGKLAYSLPKIEFSVVQMDSGYLLQQRLNFCRISF